MQTVETAYSVVRRRGNHENAKAQVPSRAGRRKISACLVAVSPWMLNYTKVSPVVRNGDIVGVIVATFSLAAILKFTVWEEWINIVAGFWLIASPWVLDYTALMGNIPTLPATANHLAVGLAIVILSLQDSICPRKPSRILRTDKETALPSGLAIAQLSRKRRNRGQMQMKKFMILAVMIAASVAAAAGTHAQTKPGEGDAAAGRRLALLACTGCHVVAPDQPFNPQWTGTPRPPDFKEIANRPDVTAASLQHHLAALPAVPQRPGMANPALGDAQLRDVVAFIISLREKPAGQ